MSINKEKCLTKSVSANLWPFFGFFFFRHLQNFPKVVRVFLRFFFPVPAFACGFFDADVRCVCERPRDISLPFPALNRFHLWAEGSSVCWTAHGHGYEGHRIWDLWLKMPALCSVEVSWLRLGGTPSLPPTPPFFFFNGTGTWYAPIENIASPRPRGPLLCGEGQECDRSGEKENVKQQWRRLWQFHTCGTLVGGLLWSAEGVLPRNSGRGWMGRAVEDETMEHAAWL